MRCLHASLTQLWGEAKNRVGTGGLGDGPGSPWGESLLTEQRESVTVTWGGQEVGWQRTGSSKPEPTPHLTPELPEVAYLHSAQTVG